LPRQLPSPGREVEHIRARTDPKLANEKVDRLRRVAGAPALVVVSGAVEATRGKLVNPLGQNFK
jgi:hypothetical protein